MPDVSKLILQERAALRQKKEVLHKNQLYSSTYSGIMKSGLVLAVDYYGNKSIGRAPYSIQIKIDKTYDTQGNDRWYEPFFQIHNISLPQVGEEIWIIFVTAGDFSRGFWFSRVNYTSEFSSNSLKEIDVSKVYKDDATKLRDENNMFGINNNRNNVVEKSDIEPKVKYIVPMLRTKPGDVLTHGRSNTHIFHTFDTKNKKGVIDIITEIEESKKKFYEQEFHMCKGARVLFVTLSNIDEIVIKNDLKKDFHKDFGANKETAYSLIQANEIRLVSPDGGNINHLILAEQYKDWMTKLVNSLKTNLDDMAKTFTILQVHLTSFITNQLQTHTHLTAVGPTALVTIPLTINIVNNDFENIKNKLNEINTDLDERLNSLPAETFSKNIACN